MSVQKKIARLTAGTLLACALLYFFPLVRIHKLGSTSTSKAEIGLNSNKIGPNGASTLDITTFVETLWTKRLPDAASQAARVDDVLAMAATDVDGAWKKYGREVGLGGPTFLFLRGRGKIESVSEDECLVIIDGLAQPVVLEIGILVSNAIRDATGLVNVGDFPQFARF